MKEIEALEVSGVGSKVNVAVGMEGTSPYIFKIFLSHAANPWFPAPQGRQLPLRSEIGNDDSIRNISSHMRSHLLARCTLSRSWLS